MEKLEELSFADLKALEKIVKKEIKKRDKVGFSGLMVIDYPNGETLKEYLKKLTLLEDQIDEIIHHKLYELIS